MKNTLVSRFVRGLLAVMIVVGLLLAVPAPAKAISYPSFEVTGVQMDEAVTIRTKDFPANINFTVRMDVAGNMAIDGIVVSEFNSGVGGVFEATYRIPAELRGSKTLAIRFESTAGYYTFGWFNNKNQGTAGSVTPKPPIPNTGSPKPSLTITGVKKNLRITVEALNLPANTDFMVRVGPFYLFAREAVETQTFNSGKGGTVVFNVLLPDVVRDVDLVAVRIDGGGHYAYNAFTNEDSGVLRPDTNPPAGYKCSITAVRPEASLTRNADFDGVWVIKNTGTQAWSKDSVDYRYLNGTKLHTHLSAYDLPVTVEPGESIKIIVDMAAPSTYGYYTTAWALVQGNSTICELPLTIRVR